MFREMLAAWGSIDILVNNAGLQKDAAFSEMTLEQWNTVIGVNLTGMFLCAREAVREMTRRGPRPEISRAVGKIICISSVHERIPWAGHANYAASKGGVKLFMQTLAQELAPARIRVNSIAPGAIQTPINRDAWETPQALKSLLNLIPYGRIGQPEDIGRVRGLPRLRRRRLHQRPDHLRGRRDDRSIPSSRTEDRPMHYDVMIIGTGAGGGTLLHALAGPGKRILVLERGDYVPREKANWSTRAVNLEGRYQTKEIWRDREGKPLHPHTNYYVGGNTKFYGAALFRLRDARTSARSGTGRRVAGVADRLRGPRALLHRGRAALPRARRAGRRSRPIRPRARRTRTRR